MADSDNDSLRKALNLPGKEDLAQLDREYDEHNKAEAQFVYFLMGTASAGMFTVVQLAVRFQQLQQLLSMAGVFFLGSFIAGVFNRRFSQACAVRRFGGNAAKLFKPIFQLEILAKIDGVAEQSRYFGMVDGVIDYVEMLENRYEEWARRCYKFQAVLLIAGAASFICWLA